MNSLQRDYYNKIDMKLYQIIKKYDIKINTCAYNMKIIINYLLYSLPKYIQSTELTIKYDYILRLSEPDIHNFLIGLPDIESIDKLFYSRKKEVYERLRYYKNTFVPKYNFTSTQNNVDKCNKVIKQIDNLIENNHLDKIKFNYLVENLE